MNKLSWITLHIRHALSKHNLLSKMPVEHPEMWTLCRFNRIEGEPRFAVAVLVDIRADGKFVTDEGTVWDECSQLCVSSIKGFIKRAKEPSYAEAVIYSIKELLKGIKGNKK